MPLTTAANDLVSAGSVRRCTQVHARITPAVSYPVHPMLCRSSSTSAPDVAAGFGSYDNSGGGAAWWQEWEPSAAEARQQQQQQQRQQQQQAPHRPRPWQPPADSDAQVLTTLTTQVMTGLALTDPDTLRWQLLATYAVLL